MSTKNQKRTCPHCGERLVQIAPSGEEITPLMILFNPLSGPLLRLTTPWTCKSCKRVITKKDHVAPVVNAAEVCPSCGKRSFRPFRLGDAIVHSCTACGHRDYAPPQNEVPNRVAEIAALATQADTQTVAPLVDSLADPDPMVRRNSAVALGRTRDPSALHPLLGALKSPDAGLRASAAKALGILGDSTAAEAVEAMLQDESPEARSNAATALGELRSPQTVNGLISALKNGVGDVRVQAAHALGKIADPRAVEALTGVYQDAGNILPLRHAAADAVELTTGKRPKDPNAGCFIATAACGSESGEVLALRRFRDEFLLKTSLGAFLIRAYYMLAPPIAHCVRRVPCLRRAVAKSIVRPAARLATLRLSRSDSQNRGASRSTPNNSIERDVVKAADGLPSAVRAER